MNDGKIASLFVKLIVVFNLHTDIFTLPSHLHSHEVTDLLTRYTSKILS